MAALEEALERAVELICERLSPVAILLFGSRARGRATPRSDYDLGLYLEGTAPDAFVLAAVKTELEDVLGCDADLVVLEDASPVVVMEALRTNQVLFCRDRDAFSDFVARTLIAYDDLKRVRAPIERAILSTESE